MSPLVSVIVPTFNRAETIGPCIASVINQDFADWELLIVDDGSADHTAEKIAEIQKQHMDRKISYIRQQNGGPSAARNTGIHHSQSDIIVYLDSDDRLYPSALNDIVSVLKDETALYGITNHNRTLSLIDQNGKELARKFDGSGLQQDVTLQDLYDWKVKTTSSGVFHRKSILNETIKWRSGFWIEDLEFLLQLGMKYPDGFRHIPKALVDYTQTYGGDGLCSNAKYLDWAHAFGSIYELHKNDPLMKNPHIYLDRVEKYKKQHQEALEGKTIPPHYKFFPEYFEKQQK